MAEDQLFLCLPFFFENVKNISFLVNFTPYAALTNRHTKAVLDEVDRVIALMEACKYEQCHTN